MPNISPDQLNRPYPKEFDSDFEPISWDAFRQTGLLAFINGFLHIFGLVIIVDTSQGVYPARTKWRGFSAKSWTKAYQKLSDYMAENADVLKSEAHEE